jgi:hypothetical protein
MLKVENVKYLSRYHPQILDELKEWEENHKKTDQILVEVSKQGESTLKIKSNENWLYIHSKYDPKKEAITLVDRIQEIENYNHILFFGVGLGYHIQEFIKRYPKIKVSIYEPNLEVLNAFFTTQSVWDWHNGSIHMIFTGTGKEEIKSNIGKLQLSVNSLPKVYTLPAYVKIYSEEEIMVITELKDIVLSKAQNLATTLSFQKRWTVNSIKNFPLVLKTTSFLSQSFKDLFHGKTAIIVSSGPSLAEEFEHLKYVKEHRLAYIFSVGSAINALIEAGVHPDAAFSFDPSAVNYKVIEKVKIKKIDSIPLVYGSSVGFETLEDYPGEMFHFVTSTDRITTAYLQNQNEISTVLDAPSIAVITFQLLSLLGFSRIILVGQNLAYMDNKRYAEGIQYEHVSSELNEAEQKKLNKIKDVFGNEVYTDNTYNSMRKSLELMISHYDHVEVINSTNNGAHIEGSKFMYLSDVIKDMLKIPIVETDWHEKRRSYNTNNLQQMKEQMIQSKSKCESLVAYSLNEIKKINRNVEKVQGKQLEKNFVSLDKEMAQLTKDRFFSTFIQPMISVEHERLSDEIKGVKYEKNLIEKGKKIADLFAKYLNSCKENIHFIEPYFEELNQEIDRFLEKK